ncbi:putative membrane protein YdjX (TVP38/TMEM64 family) [Evansella vedderi]|uniref:TVP38/TMEM64 family membrane protein n=1 Tax=Evansella vedderi TaxID=38282 RepID=A0ABU0A332_9BACI|nr:VTT domain-containing protein [Evansella vedderi]MDQ0257897.1 putative membrane protein YdjX (TVP38/TMEM64 family) [Evansella vedderi]
MAKLKSLFLKEGSPIARVLLKLSSIVLTFVLIFSVLDLEWVLKLREGELDLSTQLDNNQLIYILLFTFVLMLFQNLITIIPLFIIVMLNTVLFGFVNGFLWSWLTSVIAAVITFFLYKFWIPEKILEKVNQSSIKNKIDEKGIYFLFILRLIPFMPTSIINLAASISNIRLSHFFIATVLGNMIFQLLLSTISIGILSEGISNYILWIIVGLSIPIYFWYKKSAGKKRSYIY